MKCRDCAHVETFDVLPPTANVANKAWLAKAGYCHRYPPRAGSEYPVVMLDARGCGEYLAPIK